MPRYFLLYPCEAYPSGQMFLSRCCVRKLEYRFPEIVLLLRVAESFSNSSLSGVTTDAWALLPTAFFWLNLITMLSLSIFPYVRFDTSQKRSPV